MSTTYLGFFLNRQTKEEFVAPAISDSVSDARVELYKTYPESRYVLITIYSRSELEHVLASVDRWPGMPSKVQAPVLTDLSKVTARTGGLPPLPGQQPKVQEQVIPVTVDANGMPGWMQTLVSQTPSTVAGGRPAVPALEQAMAQRTSTPTQAAPQAFSPPSLIERLKAVRGESMPTTPVRRDPTPQVEAPISRAASGASVIDILKGMRK